MMERKLAGNKNIRMNGMKGGKKEGRVFKNVKVRGHCPIKKIEK